MSMHTKSSGKKTRHYYQHHTLNHQTRHAFSNWKRRNQFSSTGTSYGDGVADGVVCLNKTMIDRRNGGPAK